MLRFIITLTFLISFSQTFAEGTKQLRPASGDFGYMQIHHNAEKFATYLATTDERLQININKNTERIYFGFGRITDGSAAKTDVYFRIKDPNGNTVMGPTKIPSAGTGFISSYTKAVAGPTKISPATGYVSLQLNPSMLGDYYIEFNQGNATIANSNNSNRRVFEMFDITVIDTVAMLAKPGRLWSKNWAMSSNSFANQFKGTFFVYSNDGVVTSVNFNGIQPYAFRVACNTSGCTNTGNPALDRQSRPGEFTYPSYKIFLNDPDIIVYPNGVIGTIQTDIQLTGCAPNYCLNVTTDAPGNIEFLMNLNGVPGYQSGTKDITVGQYVNAGTTCIPWDGKDGLGNPVNQTINFEVNAEYKFGLTNLPIYDVENLTSGIIVSSIRPLVIKPKLFWDDTRIPGGGSNLIGCTDVACHPWPSTDFGNVNTMNTWWYVNVVKDTILTLAIPKPNPNIIGNTNYCAIDSTVTFSTNNVIGNTYSWTSSKNAITSNPLTSSITYKTKTGNDPLRVLETNSIACYEDTIFISSYAKPTPIVSGDTIACDVNTIDVYTTNNIAVNTYQWSINKGIVMLGGSTNTVQVKWTTLGLGYIEVVETTPNGCTTTKRRNVRVVAKPVITGITH